MTVNSYTTSPNQQYLYSRHAGNVHDSRIYISAARPNLWECLTWYSAFCISRFCLNCNEQPSFLFMKYVWISMNKKAKSEFVLSCLVYCFNRLLFFRRSSYLDTSSLVRRAVAPLYIVSCLVAPTGVGWRNCTFVWYYHTKSWGVQHENKSHKILSE